MRLIDAYNLLAEDGISDNHRYFSELYKQFSYRDESLLKDYLEFIFYDPVEWMRGFPKKLTTKTSFSKPKTAIIKLLKKPAVIDAVGSDFAERLHTKVWKTFKENSEALLTERTRIKSGGGSVPTMTVVEQFEPVDTLETLDTLETSDAESLHSYEELPIPDRMVGLAIAHRTEKIAMPLAPTSVITTDAVLPEEEDQRTDADRIRLLKDVLRSMAKTLPDGVSDAFVALVEYV